MTNNLDYKIKAFIPLSRNSIHISHTFKSEGSKFNPSICTTKKKRVKTFINGHIHGRHK